MKKKLKYLLLFLAITLSLAVTVSAKEFSDINSHWAEEAVERWSQYEIVNGKTENRFDPDGYMTRAEAAAVFSRLLKLEEKVNISNYSDADENAWYAEAMEKCVAAGIINGDNGKLYPNGKITREMFFTMLVRALNLPEEDFPKIGYSDENEVSEWAESYVWTLVNNKFVNGVEKNRIAPKENITRASVITLIDRIIKIYALTDGTVISSTDNGVALVLADNCSVHNGFKGTVVLAKSDVKIDLSGSAFVDVIVKSDNVSVKNAPENTKVVVSGKAENTTINDINLDSGSSHVISKAEPEGEKPAPVIIPSGTHTHIYSSTVTTKPTCVSEGVKTFSCSCGSKYTEPVDKLSQNGIHTPDSAVKENEKVGTCKTKSTYDEVVYCSVCDEELSRTSKTGDYGDHSPESAVKENETEGNCKTKSTYDEVVYCSACDEELSRIPKTGDYGNHNPASAVKENESTGTCKTKSTYDEVVYCSICDGELSRAQKTGDYGDHIESTSVKENEQEGDCETKATYDEVVYCTVCTEELSRTQKTGDFGTHSPDAAVKENETEGDCETKVTYDEVVYCTICDEELSRTSKTGGYGDHIPDSAVKENETAGNCETKATYDEVVYCSVCDKELSRTGKTGSFGNHTPDTAVKENETEGDCKTKSTYDEVVYCFICDDELSRIEKTGEYGKHNFNGVECTICHIEDPNATYTVVFKDYDGQELKTQSGIVKGGSATAPADPSRYGYIFAGWDSAFNNVTASITVTATYTKITDPTLVVNTKTANAGDTIELTVDILNNPGILGTVITLEFDSALTLTATQNGDAFANLTYTKPSKLINGCNLTWFGNETGEVTDGAVIKLTFKVSDTATAGNYNITVKCSSADTFDAAYGNVELDVINSFITVK